MHEQKLLWNDIKMTFDECMKFAGHPGFIPTPDQIDRILNAANESLAEAEAKGSPCPKMSAVLGIITMLRDDTLGLFKDTPENAGKTTYLVDVFRNLGQTIRVKADSREQAEEIADGMVRDGLVQWDIGMLTDDFEMEVAGEVGADGESNYY